MSQILDYLLEPETAVVFDIDGVLAVYEFGELCHSACPDDEWESYVRTHDPYATSRPVRQIQRFVREKGPERVWACSQASEFEAKGKRDFVLRNYDIAPDHVAIVPDKAAKVDFLRQLARGLGVEERRVALVEDTVKTLDLVCASSDCTTVHVSSFFDYDS